MKESIDTIPRKKKKPYLFRFIRVCLKSIWYGVLFPVSMKETEFEKTNKL